MKNRKEAIQALADQLISSGYTEVKIQESKDFDEPAVIFMEDQKPYAVYLAFDPQAHDRSRIEESEIVTLLNRIREIGFFSSAIVKEDGQIEIQGIHILESIPAEFYSNPRPVSDQFPGIRLAPGRMPYVVSPEMDIPEDVFEMKERMLECIRSFKDYEPLIADHAKLFNQRFTGDFEGKKAVIEVLEIVEKGMKDLKGLCEFQRGVVDTVYFRSEPCLVLTKYGIRRQVWTLKLDSEGLIESINCQIFGPGPAEVRLR